MDPNAALANARAALLAYRTAGPVDLDLLGDPTKGAP